MWPFCFNLCSLLGRRLNRTFHFLFSPRTTADSQSDSRWNPAGHGVTGGNQSPACKLQLWDPQDDMESETSKVKERWGRFTPYTIDSSSSISVVAIARNAWFHRIREKLLILFYSARKLRKNWRCNTAGFILKVFLKATLVVPQRRVSKIQNHWANTASLTRSRWF